MIYFVQAGDDGPIKIGTSNNPESRIDSLQTANPNKLKILHIGPGKRTREKAIQRHFHHLSISGEWYCPEEDLLNFIDYLNGRGFGYDMNKEVVERGDLVNLVIEGKKRLGRVLSNPIANHNTVVVSVGSGMNGKGYLVDCEELCVLEKKPDHKWAIMTGKEMRDHA